MLNLKQTHVNLESLSSSMMGISADLDLPKYFKEDLATDMKILKRFDKQPKIWSLREAGTVLVPCGMGVDPAYVSNYLSDSIFFLIDSNKSIKKIEPNEAMALFNKAPATLSRSMSNQELFDVVDGVLSEGCEYGIWGVFDRPKKENFNLWSDWLVYFQNSGNKIMIDFMAEAIRIHNIK